jgi:hypothetical protein
MHADKDIHTRSCIMGNLDIPIFAKLYDFYKQLSQYLALFPKNKRYSLGQKIDNIALEIFELLFKSGVVSKDQKLETLQNVSAKLDLLKMLVRLARDQKNLSTKAYLDLQAYLQEIGKMLGGWLKYLNNS